MKVKPFFSLPHTDIDLLRLKLKLTPGQRLRAMDDARQLVIGLKRGRLRSQYPELSDLELNLKILEEIERAKQFSCPHGNS
jgi:hypothetical protein